MKTEKKPKKPAIDPNSRPREFEFEFKKEYIGTPELPHNYNRIEVDREHAKGMTEAEAWSKIYKQEMRDGYYKRIFDQRVIRIWTWNQMLIWKEGSGEPKPEDGIIKDMDVWAEKNNLRRTASHPRSAQGYRGFGGMKGIKR